MLPRSAWAYALERRAIAAIASLRANAADLLQAAGLTLGWLLVMRGVVRLTSPVAWDFSVGLLVLSLCGWKFVGVLFWRGLYALTQDERDG